MDIFTSKILSLFWTPTTEDDAHPMIENIPAPSSILCFNCVRHPLVIITIPNPPRGPLSRFSTSVNNNSIHILVTISDSHSSSSDGYRLVVPHHTEFDESIYPDTLPWR
jgi:hypothetical protein